MKLHEIAHSRTGDKGNLSTLSLIAYSKSDYALLQRQVTADRVLEQFAPLGATAVRRYELPQLGALNFVVENVLGGGVTRSLALDAHGKALSGLLLEMEIQENVPAGNRKENGEPDVCTETNTAE